MLYIELIIFKETPIPVKEAKCFVDGLQAIQWKYQTNMPGSNNHLFFFFLLKINNNIIYLFKKIVINDGSATFKLLTGNTYSSRDYDLVRTFKQVGCKDLKI